MDVDSANKVSSASAAGWSYLSHLECARCGRTWPADELRGMCECHGVLLCRYRIDDLKRDLRREDLKAANWPLRRPPYLFETSVPRVFAVGDVRSGSVKRVASAVGEGSVVIQLIHRALAE